MKKISVILGMILIGMTLGCQLEPKDTGRLSTGPVPCQEGESYSEVSLEDKALSSIPVRVFKNVGLSTTPYKNYYSSRQTLHDTWSSGGQVTDSISSIHVYEGWEIIIYRYTNYGGYYKVLGANSSPNHYWNMNSLIMNGDSDWDNRISSIEIRPKVVVPSILDYKKKYPKNSEFGDEVNVNEVQGIANDGSYWYLSNRTRIYKCLKHNITDRVATTHVSDLPTSTLRNTDHFGDMDYYGGRLYVPAYERGVGTSYLILYDSNLNYKTWAQFPSTIKNAGWVSVNPSTGLIYATSDYKTLRVFDKNFSTGAMLNQLFTVSLDFGSLGHSDGSWWNKVWNQGGEFGDDGLFYYVLDHKSDEDSAYTGFYIFKIDGHKGKARWKANIKYDPDRTTNTRRTELEGITYWDRGNDANYPGQVHIQFLDLDANEDDCTILHYATK